jgi:UDP-N-acetylglucosamine 2-epimerase (non-hydrolysing)
LAVRTGLPDKSVAFVLGTRPEMIKVAPLVRLFGAAARVIHTGQHYDENLSGQFLAELGIGEPDARLSVGGRSRGSQIGDATSQLEAAFKADPPAAVVVHGDTNATVAGALAANALNLPLVHLEAGLRSFDRAMPEEHNRVVADHLADLCLAPTDTNRANLAAEGIGGDKVIVTGNTVVDAVLDLLPDRLARRAVVNRAGLVPGEFILATLHRPENVDEPEPLEVVLSELASLPLPVVMTLHPRTRAKAESFGLMPVLDRLRTMEPIGYREFLALAAESALLVSDSGGVQEEASIIKRPVVVVRNSTERPEILGTFAQLVPPGPLIGSWVDYLLEDLESHHQRLASLPSPYGDGTSAPRSVAAITVMLHPRARRRGEPVIAP